MDQHVREEHQLSRLLTLSDGVFAIAITLLVLELRVPQVEDVAQLPAKILGLWPNFLSYIISFLVIGRIWAGHHRMFQYIRRTDNTLVWLNIYLLLLVSFLPFPTSLVGRYGDSLFAVAFYAASVAATNVCTWLVWRHAAQNHRLIDKHVDARLIRYYHTSTLTPMAVFLLSIPIACLSPMWGMWSWALQAVAPRLIRRWFHEVGHQPAVAAEGERPVA